MFGKFRFVRNAIKSKFTYNGSEDWEGEGLRSFDNEFARNVIIFGLDNNSSYDKKKIGKIFSYYVKDQLMVLMIALVQQKNIYY